MAKDLDISNAAASAAADAVVDLLDGGTIEVRTGTKPATADTAASGTLLATLTFGTPAFGSASNGVATANSITPDSAADATGTATWFRAKASGGAAVFDGTVGTSDADLVLNSTAIQEDAEVAITSMTYTQPKSAS